MTDDLDRLKAEARALRKAHAAGEPGAQARASAVFPDKSSLIHADALHVVAREQGHESWPRLKLALETAAMDRAGRAERLTRALYFGQAWVTRHLLAQDPDLASFDLGLQVATYDRDAVARALEADPAAATTKVNRRLPILHLAFSQYIHMAPEREAAMLEILGMLLAAGADVDESVPVQPGAEHRLSALYGALGHGRNIALARRLLEHGADPNDNESLYHATELPSTEGLRLLLEAGARPEGTNALPRALDFGAPEAVRLLLEAGADPNEGVVEHPSGEAPVTLPALHQAARRGCGAEVMGLLLAHGADPAARWQGLTPYAVARVHGNAEAARVLEAAGHAPALTEAEAVLAACAEGHMPDRRLDAQALPPELRRLACRVAARPGALRHLQALILAGLDPEEGEEMGLPPLHIAGWEGIPENVDWLLTLSPDLEHRNAYGGDALGTVIHGAEFSPARAERDHVSCARLLLEAGATLTPETAGQAGTEDMAAFLESWAEG